MYRDLGSQKEEVAVDQRGESAVCVCLFFFGCFLFFLVLGRTNGRHVERKQGGSNVDAKCDSGLATKRRGKRRWIQVGKGTLRVRQLLGDSVNCFGGREKGVRW